MAVSRSNYHDRALHVLGLFSLLLLIQRGGAKQYKVGGSNGWSVPSNDQNYTQWAEKIRFQIRDTLLFKFQSGDSVLQVIESHYTKCTIDKPLTNATYSPTVFKFEQSGPFYFISGSKNNCLDNEKLHVLVFDDRTGNKKSPPPPPANSNQSPGPYSNQSQTQSPPNSGAYSSSTSSMGLFGTFVGLSIVFGF